MAQHRLLRIVGAILGLSAFFDPQRLLACATSDRLATAEDFVTAEQAVIIWDATHKIEHFIRQADIHTEDPDLGFLVPTPQTPELAEADPAIFELAAAVAKPKSLRNIIYRTPLEVFWPVLRGPLVLAAPFYALITGMSERGPDEVKILLQQNVSGYHAVVLAADDPNAVAQWLSQNNYVSTPQLARWLKPYIAAKWKITAFKLIKTQAPNSSSSDHSQPIVTHAIRMSFATEHPFFPYSEPGDKQKAHRASPYGRTLRIAVLSSGRMTGKLADGTTWPGDLLYAGSPQPPPHSTWTKEAWLTFAKLDDGTPLPNTLTYWRDRSNPRPGTADLYFSLAPDQNPFRKAEIDYSLPTLHLIDLSHPLSDLAGLLIIVMLPGAPLYCGWRLIRQNREIGAELSGTPIKAAASRAAEQIFGLVAVTIGGFYSVSCIIIAFLLRQAYEELVSHPFPAFATPLVATAVALLFWTQIYCGMRVGKQALPQGKSPMPRSVFGNYWDYCMAAGSILIGVTFSLAILVVFIDSFIE